MSNQPHSSATGAPAAPLIPRFYLDLILVGGGAVAAIVAFGVLTLWTQARHEVARIYLEAGAPRPAAMVASTPSSSSSPSLANHPGKALFQSCAACHGADAGGQAALKAPALNTQDPWYIARQLEKFRQGVRGRDPRDSLGATMAGMAQALPTSAAVEQVADYIAALRPADGHRPTPTLKGDPARGKELYATCVACHGAAGEGNQALNAPALAGQHDWYIVHQLQSFKEGFRGGTPQDTTGALMRPMATGLNEQQMTDLAAHIVSFPLPPAGRAAPTVATRTAAVAIPPGELVAAGDKLFAENCASCHQPDGAGKVGLAPSIRNRDFLALASDDFITATIQGGRPGTSMVARADLSSSQLAAIVAWLRALEVPNPLPVTVDLKKVYAGNVASGAGKYVQYCSSCHGPRGEGYSAGGSGPGIGLAGFLDVASDDYIYQTLKVGRVGTPMRPFIGAGGLANLDPQDAYDIIAYLRSLNLPHATSQAAQTARGIRSRGDARHGEQLFATHCAACHQRDGQGKAGLAPSIRNRDFLAIASDSFIRATVIDGRPGTSMVGRPNLTDDDLTDLIAWLRALPVENPVTIHVDPAKRVHGDAVAGAADFAQYCASCHGPQGEGYSAGGSGPGIGLPGFLNVASDDYIIQTVKQGRVGTAMRPFIGPEGLAALAEEDVYDIITYLRQLQAAR